MKLERPTTTGVYGVSRKVYIFSCGGQIVKSQKGSSAMFVICGKSGSGKNTIANELIKRSYRMIVTYTTRPKREGEEDGVTYHYIDDSNFDRRVREGFFLEYKEYNTAEGVWYYGSSLSDEDIQDEKAFIILSPSGVKAVRALDKSIVMIYLYANRGTIKERLLKRGDNKNESARRMMHDIEDFAGLTGLGLKIVYNNLGDQVSDVADRIERIIGVAGHGSLQIGEKAKELSNKEYLAMT